MGGSTDDRTVVSEPGWLTPALWVGLPLVGGVLGWVLTLVAEWYVGLPVAPLQGPVEWLTDLSTVPRIAVAVGVGVVAGLVIALLIVSALLTVTVDRRGIETKRGDDEQRAEAAAVASVFVEDKRMVVLGHRGEELVSVEFDLDRRELRAAVERHGYRWSEGDPFKDAYRLWVPDAEGLPAGANPVLKARQGAVRDGKGDDAAELRAELAKLGVVVRDEDKKQHWRLIDESAR
ncbi:YqeB family protein [Glycomyces tenuis]|uniref:YqeB family protein n=1 Tax=Glycomyces tenuis TaxID=58116 RepID=UPI00042821C6|nr:hypothetical protein [Glycomyces tenuis]